MIGELYCGVKKTDIETLNFIKEKEYKGTQQIGIVIISTLQVQ
ncbi:hypothetical protein BEI61_05790 [Eisenbergiella tayi]|uniref:Uncharacterized protein n=1 Tax=Eisenbergiella tayi TaxID=1432052 RepID=A0A1E2ZZ88_9FIRM|nr:hypothetical protein BEI61_05790 [Eisenbergiella tayi]